MTTLIVAHGVRLPQPQPWRAAGIAVQVSDESAHQLVHELRRGLAAAGPRTLAHGVLLSVHGTGVLLEGPAGAGKSTLALELLARGHALVADDVAELHRPAPGIVLGRAPALLRGYLEARGLGVLDVRRLHGRHAVRRVARLDLVVRLVPRLSLRAADRLGGQRSRRRVLGESVTVLSLPLQARHNLPTLVEAACLDQRLRLEGGAAGARLARSQARAIRQSRP